MAGTRWVRARAPRVGATSQPRRASRQRGGLRPSGSGFVSGRWGRGFSRGAQTADIPSRPMIAHPWRSCQGCPGSGQAAVRGGSGRSESRTVPRPKRTLGRLAAVLNGRRRSPAGRAGSRRAPPRPAGPGRAGRGTRPRGASTKRSSRSSTISTRRLRRSASGQRGSTAGTCSTCCTAWIRTGRSGSSARATRPLSATASGRAGSAGGRGTRRRRRAGSVRRSSGRRPGCARRAGSGRALTVAVT